MNLSSSVVLVGVIVTLGQWSKGDKVPLSMFIGLAVLSLSLAAMYEANDKLARQFAFLIVVTAVLTYMIPITKSLGYTK